MTQYYYSNTASVAALSAPINTSSPSVTLSGFSGFPTTYPFWAIIDRGEATAEVVVVTNVVGSTATISRGQDGTLAADHNGGATFEHIIPASLPNRAEAHMEATTGVHGVTGALVGTTDAQTVTSKTYRGGFVHSYADAAPVVTAGFEVTASTAAAKDGFKHTNTGADSARRGFLLEQSGTPRFEVFNDGTERVTPNTAHTNAAVEARVGAAKTGLRVSNADAANAATFTVAGNGNTVVSGTLAVTGATTLASASTGDVTSTNMTVTGDASVGDDLTVTGDVLVTGQHIQQLPGVGVTDPRVISSSRPGGVNFRGRNESSVTTFDVTAEGTVTAAGRAYIHGTASVAASGATTAAVVSPAEGDVVFDQSVDRWKHYASSAWAELGHGLGILGGRTFSGTGNIGAAVTATEVAPTDLNSTALNLVANRRYNIRARVKGEATASDQYLFKIRKSTVTGAVLREYYHAATAGIGEVIEFSTEYATTAAETAVVFVVTVQRISGAGQVQIKGAGTYPAQPTGVWVEDVGPTGTVTLTAV